MAEASEDSAGRPPRLWHYGLNDFLEEDAVARAARDFKPTGRLRDDFAALCRCSGAVPHSAFLPASNAPAGAAEAPALSVQSLLMDRATAQVLRHVLPAAAGLRELRFSGCRLDVEQLDHLKHGISGDCTVTTLHLDWNSLDLPHEDPAEVRRLGAEGREDELDQLEGARARRQAQRHIRTFGERLTALCGDVPSGFRGLAEAAAEGDASLDAAALAPLDLATWTRSCQERLRMSSEEAAQIFAVLDDPGFGGGDGAIALSQAQAAVERCAAPGDSADVAGEDPLGAAFAGFLDAASTLEVLSLRSCGIGLAESRSLGRALGTPSPHLKALNLWGNRLCDASTEFLSAALETNYGLQYLGLGRNLITHVGLERLCRPLGVTVLYEKSQADPVIKAIKELTKSKEKKPPPKGGPPPPKADASGRERYVPEVYVPSCDEYKDPSTHRVSWLWTRNIALKTLVLENNPVVDAKVVRRLLPFGCGDLVLRGAPCAEELLHTHQPVERRRSSTRSIADEAPAATETAAAADDAPAPDPLPPFIGAAAAVKGWRLVLR